MDRGLHYGDGLFETIACVEGSLQLWDEHIERMQNAAKKLSIESIAINNFKQDVLAILKQHSINNCVVKLMLTRGQGQRGYQSPSPQKTTRIVVIGDLPQYSDEFNSHGIKACFCQHPISKNSALAGIKHLNRLDNVLARNEWRDEYQEGLMLDDSNNIIEGTMSNVFASKNNQLLTPSLENCGVNGIIREQILAIAQEQGIETHVTNIKKDDIKNMDEVFVCNSIIGIWPISSLGNNIYEVGSMTQQLSQALQQRICAQ
ncbi:MAG: aminodeoxychorismate lyase [Gammaproteobacteria bacterium]|nr:aminodeoxychorismate lyase [Gammaproteobacteria bacterium]